MNCNGCLFKIYKYTDKIEYCQGCCNFDGDDEKPDRYELDI